MKTKPQEKTHERKKINVKKENKGRKRKKTRGNIANFTDLSRVRFFFIFGFPVPQAKRSIP